MIVIFLKIKVLDIFLNSVKFTNFILLIHKILILDLYAQNREQVGWSESSYILGLIFVYSLHCVSKNDTHIAHYNFDAHQPILVIFGRDVTWRACYQTVICYPTSPN